MPIDQNFFKSPYERVFDGIDQYELRSNRNGGGVEQDYGDPYAQVRSETDQLFPELEGLSGEQQQQLDAYKNRLRRLQAAEAPQAGSPRIGGNPYSIDTRNLLQGGADLATSLVNKEREDRIYGNENKADRASRGAQAIGALGDLLGSDGLKKVREKSRDRREERYAGFNDEATALENKKEAARQNRENRQNYMEENVPERTKDYNERVHENEQLKTKEEGKTKRNNADNVSLERRNTQDNKYDKQIANRRAENKKELERIKNSYGNDYTDPRFQGAAYNKLLDQAADQKGLVRKQIENLQQIQSTYDDPKSDEYLNYKSQIEAKKKTLRQLDGAQNYIRSKNPTTVNNADVLKDYTDRIYAAGTPEYEQKYGTGADHAGGEGSSERYGITEEDVAGYAKEAGIPKDQAREELEAAAKEL